jgi:hypothetical protein
MIVLVFCNKVCTLHIITCQNGTSFNKVDTVVDLDLMLRQQCINILTDLHTHVHILLRHNNTQGLGNSMS